MGSTEPVREWVGGRLKLPAQIETMGDRRAEMSLWVELPDLKVVGQVLEDPLDPQASFGQSLMRAMASPLVGEPRRPERVRVADAALADQLKNFSFLRVEVAPTPEFDKVARSLGAFFGEGSYFSDPELTPRDIERLFIGARLLWAVKPPARAGTCGQGARRRGPRDGARALSQAVGRRRQLLARSVERGADPATNPAAHTDGRTS